MISLFLRQMNFSSSHRWHHQLQFLCDFLVEFDHKMSDAYKHFHSDTVINIHETSNMEEFPFFFSRNWQSLYGTHMALLWDLLAVTWVYLHTSICWWEELQIPTEMVEYSNRLILMTTLFIYGANIERCVFVCSLRNVYTNSLGKYLDSNCSCK